jgi:hypothetical protein
MTMQWEARRLRGPIARHASILGAAALATALAWWIVATLPAMHVRVGGRATAELVPTAYQVSVFAAFVAFTVALALDALGGLETRTWLARSSLTLHRTLAICGASRGLHRTATLAPIRPLESFEPRTYSHSARSPQPDAVKNAGPLLAVIVTGSEGQWRRLAATSRARSAVSVPQAARETIPASVTKVMELRMLLQVANAMPRSGTGQTSTNSGEGVLSRRLGAPRVARARA